jgi:16S rRNA (cytosine967-C5)-methyltransferase
VKAAPALAQALRDAAQIVAHVQAGRSLADEFERLAELGSVTPRAVLIDLTHGTLRRYGRVQRIVQLLSHRGRADAAVQALLWCAIYALESRRYAEYTVVDQAVRAAGLLEKWAAKGYVNALLRAFLREQHSLDSRIPQDEEARYQHPAWWIEALRAAFPREWQEVLAAGNTHPPMCVRVNRRRQSAPDYAQRLLDEGIKARHIAEDALLLEHAVPVERLPGFAEGTVSIQDAGAQRAAHCLDLRSGQRVLDACAAPGGKSGHILELAEVMLTALDADRERAARIEGNLRRLGLAAQILVADCTQLAQWWTGTKFDRVLADVPCSASGIARRRPDLKWLRRAHDLPQFAARQAEILDALWQTLTADGKLLYVTCSVFPQENEEVIDAFLARTGDAQRAALPDGGAAQWLPAAEHDGFYYALIEKRA